ncbi:low molecular weight protein-tyrosine-phosphatase [Xanthomonas oryzae pv. oryzicola]|uniref:protein-tyrosine-phosphatase n=1 Tax=Xanthomonas oryzae pv. oryzicola (strain BLS256) TaxID=383407 RepID=G7TGV6_XANOB|nr:low molecular weight protein-tyrosine-phosphatase [Xanthomonas oryzae]AEQ96700.1 low molecular weight phosphotyrosine protein phosphatase [Xanthomonas oryzae pv. oryzicola BLS256]AJQ87795.1 phosphotyrosine protein phosphatase [Xanthomonas oryzae pv. oryzicola]AKK64234.1 phosphotyrosine protein phosphatase [Xanthomonas oryzae pv. oryzicola]AKN93235.1 phosphotyrosine protein phosphatase [Xanthomonas oryzae pv. oryzicola]AKN96965.1 phosphotyrosine protein phosphatase [Xanthomonas oryzae pv. or
MKVLIVCLGNICRSPMGEGALRAQLDKARLSRRIEVDSAGTGDWHAGDPPDSRAIRCARGHGVDIADLRARQVTRSDFEHFDWLLCADGSNLRDLQRLAPAAQRDKVALWLPWAGIDERDDIPDPYTGSVGDFEQVWQLVDAAARLTVARLTRG